MRRCVRGRPGALARFPPPPRQILGFALNGRLRRRSEAAYTLLGKRASDDLSPVAVAALGAGLSLPLFVPFAVPEALAFDWGSVAASDGWALGWWGAGTLALGSALWYLGVRAVPGSIAAAFMGVMPVSALALSYGLLGEPFHGSHAVGFAIVFAGVVLISIEHARMEQD